jgi:hypothetical protein
MLSTGVTTLSILCKDEQCGTLLKCVTELMDAPAVLMDINYLLLRSSKNSPAVSMDISYML